MLLVFVSILVLVSLGLWENIRHQKNLRSIPLRILVNGTRGKTSTARLLVAALNKSGIPTMGRTTGSEAQILYPDGHVEPFKRRVGARITEMIPLFRLASQNKVKALVVECMALHPENQRTLARTLVKPNYVLMTNTFVDHVAEMGPTIEDYYDALPSSVIKVVPSECTIEGSIPIHPSSYALVKAVLMDLGGKTSVLEESAKEIVPDIGLLSDIVGEKGSVLIPTFSVNDLTCMGTTLDKANADYPERKLSVIFNNRADREYRILLVAKVLRCHQSQIGEVIVLGDYPRKVARYLRFHTKLPVTVSPVDALVDRIGKEENGLFVGLGNIKGAGEKLIALTRKEEK